MQNNHVGIEDYNTRFICTTIAITTNTNTIKADQSDEMVKQMTTRDPSRRIDFQDLTFAGNTLIH
jgi:hypothetical protein